MSRKGRELMGDARRPAAREPNTVDLGAGPRTLDSYGYEALTLRGLILALADLAQAEPHLLDQQVWYPSGRVFQPVTAVDPHGRPGTRLRGVY